MEVNREELTNQPLTQEEVSSEQSQAPEANKVVENYESLVKQQQAQLEQLMKQQELTNKVNQQLMNQMANLSKNQAVSATSPEEHWIDKVLREEFQHEAQIDPVANKLEFFNRNTKQVAIWWLKYLKDKGLSNDEIAQRYYRMASGIEAESGNSQ